MKPENVKLLRNIAVVLIFGATSYTIYDLLNGGNAVFAILAAVGAASICGFIGAYGWKWMVNAMLSIFVPIILTSLASIFMNKYNVEGILGILIGWGTMFSGIPFIIFYYKKKSIIALPLYLVFMAPIMFIYIFYFACAFFGECL